MRQSSLKYIALTRQESIRFQLKNDKMYFLKGVQLKKALKIEMWKNDTRGDSRRDEMGPLE